MTARRVKYAVKELVANELYTMAGESLEYILRPPFRSAQRRIMSVVYDVIEEVMWAC